MAGVRQDGTAFFSGPLRRLDGSVCPMDLQASRVPWGRTEAFIVTLRDVSERYRAQQRLADEKEQLAVTLRSMGDGVITTNTERAGRSCSTEQRNGSPAGPSARRQGMLLDDVLPLFSGPRRKSRATSGSTRCCAPASTVELYRDVQTRARSGAALRTLALKAAPIHCHEGRNNGVVVVFRDTTTEQKLEEELQKASKLESVALGCRWHRARFQQHPHRDHGAPVVDQGQPDLLAGGHHTPSKKRVCTRRI